MFKNDNASDSFLLRTVKNFIHIPSTSRLLLRDKECTCLPFTATTTHSTGGVLLFIVSPLLIYLHLKLIYGFSGIFWYISGKIEGSNVIIIPPTMSCRFSHIVKPVKSAIRE